jgi:hypothetical protein
MAAVSGADWLIVYNTGNWESVLATFAVWRRIGGFQMAYHAHDTTAVLSATKLRAAYPAAQTVLLIGFANIDAAYMRHFVSQFPFIWMFQPAYPAAPPMGIFGVLYPYRQCESLIDTVGHWIGIEEKPLAQIHTLMHDDAQKLRRAAITIGPDQPPWEQLEQLLCESPDADVLAAVDAMDRAIAWLMTYASRYMIDVPFSEVRAICIELPAHASPPIISELEPTDIGWDRLSRRLLADCGGNVAFVCFKKPDGYHVHVHAPADVKLLLSRRYVVENAMLIIDEKRWTAMRHLL